MASPELTTELIDPRARQRAELRNVITIAFPVVVTTSSRALMDISDFIMITKLDLNAAQAAILPAQLIMWSYIVIGLGVVSMVNTFSAQALGRKRHHECSSYAWQSLYIAVVVGAIGAAARPFLPQLIALFRHDLEIQHQELQYARVALLTVGPTLAASGLGWFFIGIHRPWVTMWSVLEANVVNVVVSAVLIFGFLGFRPRGIAGAAWGTLAAVCYRTVRLSITMLGPKVSRVYASRSQWWFSWRRFKALVRVGLPCGMHWVSEVVVWAIFVNVLVGTSFGTVHLLATNIVWQYMRVSFMPTIGMGQALTAIVGKSLGEANPDRAIRETRYAALLTFAYMGTFSIVYALAGDKLVGLFNGDEEVISIGMKIMLCAAVFQLFDALGITYQSALRGAGDTFVPSVVFIISSWIVIIGGGYAARQIVPQWGSLGPWLAASTFIAGTGVFLWWRWHGRAWMKINLLDDEFTESPDHADACDVGAAVATVADV